MYNPNLFNSLYRPYGYTYDSIFDNVNANLKSLLKPRHVTGVDFRELPNLLLEVNGIHFIHSA